MTDFSFLSKADLVRQFWGLSADDEPLGRVALYALPERFFRQVVAQHNLAVDALGERLTSRRGLACEVTRLRVTSFEEYQKLIDDPDRRRTVPPEHRKLRDFEVYRQWVLAQAPIATVFRKTFMSSLFGSAIPEQSRRRHTFLVGQSGSGKSEVLKLLALSSKLQGGEVQRDRSVVVIDPHGDLVQQIARKEAFARDFEKHPEDPDLIVIDPFFAARSGRYPTLNPLDLSGRSRSPAEIEKLAQQLSRVIESLVTKGDQTLSANMETLLIPCLTVLLCRPGSTLFDLLRFFSDERNEDLVELGKSSLNAGHRFFFEESFGEGRFGPTKGALSTKIQSLLNNEIFARVLAEPRSTLDLEAALEAGKTILVDCSVGKLGPQTSEALGRFVVGMILANALSRAEGKSSRTPIWLFLDEAQTFVSDEIKVILTEARKYGLHLTLATQVVGQDMSPAFQRIVLGNTAVKMLGAAGADSQALLAKEMRIPVSLLQDLSVGEFVVKAGEKPPLRMRMRADFLGWRGSMKPDQWKALRRRMVERYYREVDLNSEARERKDLRDEIVAPVATTARGDRPKYDDDGGLPWEPS